MSDTKSVQTIKYTEPDTPIDTIARVTTLNPKHNGHETFDSGTRAVALSILNRNGVEGVPRIIELKTEIKEDGSQIRTATIEKIPGENLSEKYTDKPATPEETVEILLQLATICSSMLDYGIYHNDIKPVNIMINDKGKVTLVDFDAAMIIGNENIQKENYYKGLTHICHDDGVFGARSLKSPERQTGKGHYIIDGRSEIYSMCATGLLLLTGMKPVSPQLFISTLNSQQTTNLQSEIYDLLLGNLKKKPEKRISTTIQNFKEQLESLHKQIMYNNNNAT